MKDTITLTLNEAWIAQRLLSAYDELLTDILRIESHKDSEAQKWTRDIVAILNSKLTTNKE